MTQFWKLATAALLAVGLFSNVSLSEEPTLDGYIDQIVDGVAGGWAIDMQDQGASVEVQFFVDDPKGRNKKKFSGVTQAILPRPDLLTAGFQTETHGFQHEINFKFLDGKPHKLYAFAVSTKDPKIRHLLGGSGMEFKFKRTIKKK